MASSKINTKTIARIAAVQTIYQFEQNGQTDNIDVLIKKILLFYQNETFINEKEILSKKPVKIKLSKNYFSSLVKFTADNLKIIDQIITKFLTSEWTINSLPILLLALLRVAICEFKFFPETPHKVIINEFTDIASEMLTDNEVGFVNSILDKITKEI